MDIESGKRGYFVAKRDFETAELKLLVDAVQSSKFITRRKTGELIKKLEKLTEQRVTISSKQAKALQKRVQARSAALCDKHGFLYADDGETFRRAIWRDLKGQYGIDDIHDLPAVYFDIAAQYIDSWQSFSLVRKLRARRG